MTNKSGIDSAGSTLKWCGLLAEDVPISSTRKMMAAALTKSLLITMKIR